MSTYSVNAEHEAIQRQDLLADFTQDKRILILSLMALVIGGLSAVVAYGLVKLIALITNLAFHFSFSTADTTPTTQGWGYGVMAPFMSYCAGI